METQIINLYQSGYAISKIQQIVNIPYNQISLILKQNNIKVEDRQKIRSESKMDKAKELYLSGLSLTAISKQLKIDRHTLSRYFKKYQIPIINRQNAVKFDNTVFDSIDSEEKAYWLGFLYADGNLSSTVYNIELGLKESDKEHLNKYIKFLNHSDLNKVKFHKGKLGNSYRVTLTDKHMWNTLNNIGCTPRKSLTLTFPDIDYKIDFIRGYFDGDGCISYNKNINNVSPNCSLISTNEFLTSIQTFLKDFNINCKIVSDKRYKGNTKILKFSVNDGRKFMDLIYSNASIYLNRKYNRYLFFKEFCRSPKELDELLASEIGESCDANPEVN